MQLSTIKDTLFFITNNKETAKLRSLKEKVAVLIKLYLFLYVFGVAFNFLFFFLVEHFGLNRINEESSYKEIDKALIVISLFVIPLYEEIMFRLFLTKFEKWKFLISSSFIASFIVHKFTHGYFVLTEEGINILSLGYLFILTIVFFIAFLYLLKIYRLVIMSIWERYFLFVFYSVSFLFTILHFNNAFSLNSGYTFLNIIYFMPIFILGITLGYIRVNIGFWYAVVFHIAFNTPSTLIRLFM